ncbi:hypothetical protein GW950_01215 [Candidatus Wolfebacteria bacterium]|nr:hypothetical protein [Candidatus Wolfebacteria bacterium]
MMHSNKNWHMWVGKALWSLAALAFVLGWVSLLRQQLVFSLDPVAWYWNALVLGVLAVPSKNSANCCKMEEPQA